MLNLILTKFVGVSTFLTSLSEDARWLTEWKDIDFMKDFLVACDEMAFPFMMVCCMIGCIYSVVLGVNMAKSDGNNIAESKKKIIAAISSMIAIVVLIILFKFVFIPNLTNFAGFINSFTGK